VLIECDHLKRTDWPLALVVEVLPDKDGTVRLARVKTQNRILLRPVQKLYSLEVSSKEDPLKKSVEEKNEVPPVMKITTRSGRLVNKPLKYKTLFSY